MLNGLVMVSILQRELGWRRLCISLLAFAFWVLLLNRVVWLRWSMVEVAHAAVRVWDSKFRAFFLRVRAKKGKKTAYVAVARKLLVVVHHLLVTGEEYVEEGLKVKRLRAIKAKDLVVPFEEALRLLVKSGYVASGTASKWMLS